MAKKKIDQIDYIKLYQEVFSTDQGKLVLMDMCDRARVFRPFPVKDINNEFTLGVCEGQRQYALDILSKVNYDLNKLLELKETHSLEVQYDR